MMFMNQKEVERLRKRYPVGTVVMLDYMDDPYRPVPSGTTGTVDYVDDAGTIHVSWENGSTLGICPAADRFHVIRKEEA